MYFKIHLFLQYLAIYCIVNYYLFLISHYRQKLQDEYVRQVGTVFQQWESDLEKAKEQEEKLNVR